MIDFFKRLWWVVVGAFDLFMASRHMPPRRSDVPLGYHKLTCSVYAVPRKTCNCGAGDNIKL